MRIAASRKRRRNLSTAGSSCVLAALLTFWAAACGDDASAPLPPPPPPPVPSAVTVTPSAAMLAALGDTVRFAAEVRDQHGRAMPGVAVARTSSDASVATVDDSGLATMAGNGTATITAASGSASGTATVTVEQSAASVAVSPDSVALAVGDTIRLSAEVRDRRGLLRDLPGSVRTLAEAVGELGAGPNVEVLFSRGIPDVDREP